MSGRAFAVINPASANGRTGKRWPELASALRAAMGEFDHAFTEAPGEATEITERALAEGHQRIISVGGDGTHNEVVNGFFDDATSRAPEAMLYVVPTGTGGDLRRTLGLPDDPVEAIQMMGANTPGDPARRVDVGHLTYTTHGGGQATRCFINVASFGMSGLVDKLVNESGKWMGSKGSFVWGTARAAVRYKNQRVTLSIDGGPTHTRPVRILSIANARYFGGGMHIAPDAQMDDGAFDLVDLGDMSLGTMARHFNSIYAGRHVDLDDVTVVRATRVEAAPAEPDQEVLIDLDGEQPGRLPATFTILPRALKLGFTALESSPADSESQGSPAS